MSVNSSFTCAKIHLRCHVMYLFIGKENLFYCLKYDTVPLCSSFYSESVKIKTENCRQMNLTKFSNLFTVYIRAGTNTPSDEYDMYHDTGWRIRYVSQIHFFSEAKLGNG